MTQAPTAQEAKFAIEYAEHCLEFQRAAVDKAEPSKAYLRRKNVRSLEATLKILKLYALSLEAQGRI